MNLRKYSSEFLISDFLMTSDLVENQSMSEDQKASNLFTLRKSIIYSRSSKQYAHRQGAKKNQLL